MFGNLMQQMEEMKRKTEETRKRLDEIYVTAKSPDDGVEVKMNGNRKVSGIKINEELLQDKEQLEDMLVIAFNRAVELAEKVNEAEMGSIARDMLPGMMP